MKSPSFKLAALDQDYLLGDSTRGVRFMLEYQKAEEMLRAQRIASTIVVFGSARTRENGPPDHAHWYAQAREFGRIASERGGALCEDGEERCNVIATGGGPGAMEAACRGAMDVGAPAIGFNITLPHEQEPNAYTTPSLTFNFHYFAMRKMHLAMRAKGLVVFPGGFGTLDELFELLTLRQTRKLAALPIVLFDEGYWRSILNLDAMVKHGVIDGADLTLFRYADTALAAWEALVEQGLAARFPDGPI
ncbi:MAG: LOG family protein [Terricaulis sp.]|nr:LOG family protein [Terricaulis sp.]